MQAGNTEWMGNDPDFIDNELYLDAVYYVIRHKDEDPIIKAAYDQTFGALFDGLPVLKIDPLSE